MDSWWHSLNIPLQIFYGMGVIAGIFLVIETALALFGFSHHDMPDSASGHPDQLGMLSLRTITGFFFGFGWAGAIALKSGLPLLAAIIIGGIVGSVFLLGIYALMRLLFSMRASGTLDYKNAIGQVATVYVTIPPNRQGGGQVEVLIQGRLQMIACMTAHPEPIPPQTKVRVTGLIDQGTLDVNPL